jgi:hypothetical protein
VVRFLLALGVERGDSFSNEVLVSALIDFATHDLGDELKDDLPNAR